MIRRAMLETHVPWSVEQHVDDHPFRGGEQHLLHERLALVATTVATYQLHPGLGQRDVEDPGVRRVHQIQAHDLSRGRLTREPALAVYEHGIPEPAHRHEVRTRAAEGCHLTLLD